MEDASAESQQSGAKMSYFALFINILASPSEAFEELHKRPSKLVPLAVVILVNAAIIFWYFSVLDFDWFVDDLLQNGNIPEDRIDEARENFEDMSPSTFRLFGLLGGSAAILVMYTILSGYLTLTSALAGHSEKFGQWFSLVVWTGIVVLFSQLGMAVTLMLATNGQIGQLDLDPTNLRNLGLRPESDDLQQIFATINLTMIWSLVLTVLGYRQWLGTSTLKAALIVSAPYVLIFGVWSYFALG